MKTLSSLIAGCTLVGLVTGCSIIEVPVTGNDDEDDGQWVDNYSVNAYVDIPYDVRVLIRDAVNGYSMPPVDRYGYEIYPIDSHDPYNIPSYVSDDFNGDGYDDYAYMFSAVSWDNRNWYVDTKLLVVTSDGDDYSLSMELDLGTASGSRDIPVEEYWGIRLLRPGTHTITDYNHGTAHEKSVVLSHPAIYLASINPVERSVFVVDENNVTEIVVDFGAIAKRKAVTESLKDRKFLIPTSTLMNSSKDTLNM
jgi:hypothetical protein